MTNETNWQLHIGDALTVLRGMESDSIHCVVTSPPYFGLRSYLDATDPNKALEMGSEPTPAAFVSALVEVFREVRRVLRPDGTCFLNLGDSYCGYKGDNYGVRPENSKLQSNSTVPKAHNIGTPHTSGFKSKCLMMIPARVAIALCDDGWILRSDIIWAKRSCMPESVTDRPTSAHEHIFLLAKNERYFYDANAIREPAQDWGKKRDRAQSKCRHTPGQRPHSGMEDNAFSERGRNCRNVWDLSTQPYPESHFAVFTEELPKRCILAGCPVGGTVLDPFAGSGTTLAVALRLGRKAIGIDLNACNEHLIRKRIGAESGCLAL